MRCGIFWSVSEAKPSRWSLDLTVSKRWRSRLPPASRLGKKALSKWIACDRARRSSKLPHERRRFHLRPRRLQGDSQEEPSRRGGQVALGESHRNGPREQKPVANHR